jgi:hypothetical protein
MGEHSMNHEITGAAENFAIYREPERTEENTRQAEYTMIYFFLLASSSSRCKEKNPSATAVREDRCRRLPWRHATYVGLRAWHGIWRRGGSWQH